MTRLFLAVLLLLAASPALANQSVDLRPDAAAHGGLVSLGDLFDDAGAAGQVVLASGVTSGRQTVLDAGRVQAIAAAHGLDWSNPQGLKVIIVTASAQASGRRAAVAAAEPRRDAVLTWARDLQPGEVVQSEDLAWSKSAATVPIETPRDPRDVVGQAVRRPLHLGDAVSRTDVAPAQVIRKDDVVQVVYRADGMKLSLQGKALGPAAIGQSVSVLNPASKKVIEAVASGPGEALVGPEADRLKAEARADPSLYASLR
jgi:flagella basal body P-ring formation protein FlgA